MTAQELLDAALLYADRGWPIFPLQGKVPCKGSNGFKDATTDKVRIRAWWQDGRPYNIGLATGSASGVFVLDVDPDKGGGEALRRLETQYGNLPDTPQVLTGSGGIHYYFAMPDLPLSISASVLDPGLDTRANGGYVVLPPSIHPVTERPYRWEVLYDIDDFELAPLPTWIIDRLRASRSDKEPPMTAESTIAEGARNDTLFRYGCRLRRMGNSEAEILACLTQMNADRCHPPLFEKELAQIAKQCAQYAPGTLAGGHQAQNGLNSLNSLNSSSNTEKTTAPPWPTLHPAALYGLPGEIVKLIAPQTEADSVALLGQLLCAFGVAVGHKPRFYVDGADHFMNLFVTLVGRTARGRKGTSASYIRRLFQWHGDSDAAHSELEIALPIVQGLSSGEGLVWKVHDPITKREPVKEKGRVIDYQDVLADEGVTDKRILVMESEFSRVLRVMERDTNTLSETIREAWDTGDLSIITKNSPAMATGAHIGIIGHITAEELQRCLTETTAANGFGNRFLWLCVKRSRVLPEGGNIDQIDFLESSQRLRQAVRFARDVDKLTRSEDARTLWHEAYLMLTDERPGLLGSILGRAEAQVLRLSCIYALMDQSTAVDLPHLEAALAFWQYAQDSAVYLFGDSLGDPLADEILRMLRLAPEGLSRTDISNIFGRNRKSAEIGAALERLMSRHLASVGSIKTEDAKRPIEMWYATHEKVNDATKLTKLTNLIRATATDESDDTMEEGEL